MGVNDVAYEGVKKRHHYPNHLSYPETTGSYQIASKTIVLERFVDQSPSKFKASHGALGDAKRELTVTFWYPRKNKQFQLPNDLDSHGYQCLDLTALFDERVVQSYVDEEVWALLRSVQTNTLNVDDVEVAGGMHPLVIYSHGVGLNRTAGSIWCEELASQGFVVASIDHLGFIERSKVLTMPMMEIRDTYFKDISYLLDKLFLSHAVSGENVWGKLTTSIDMDNIGIFGHSIGGGASWQLLWQDARIKAAISLDGLLTNRVFSKIPSYQHKPMLIMYPMRHLDAHEFHPSESGPSVFDDNLRDMFHLSTDELAKTWLFSKAKLYPDHNTVNVAIPNAGHFSFSDNVFIKPFLIPSTTAVQQQQKQSEGNEGNEADENGAQENKPPPPPTMEEVLGVGNASLDAQDFIRITRQIVVHFFSHHLIGIISVACDTKEEEEEEADIEAAQPITPPRSDLPCQYAYFTLHPSKLSTINKSKSNDSDV